MSFPSAIGGIPYQEDLVPSVFLAIAYACLLPLVGYRFSKRKSLSTVPIGSSLFAIGRIATFWLRATQAASESKRFTLGLISFTQSDMAIGYIVIASDVVNMLRTFLIPPTYGSDTYVQPAEAGMRYRYWISSAKLNDIEGPLKQKKFPRMPPGGTPDHLNPKTRRWIRIGTVWLLYAFLAASIMGLVAASNFGNVVKGTTNAQTIMSLRFTSAKLTLGLMLCIIGVSIWGCLFLPRTNKLDCASICSIAYLMCIVAVYRLDAMRNTTNSLQSTAPGSLNSHEEKAAFYFFHVLPEWFSILLLLIGNIWQECSIGLLGDPRLRDEILKELKMGLEEAGNQLKMRVLETPELRTGHVGVTIEGTLSIH